MSSGFDCYATVPNFCYQLRRVDIVAGCRKARKEAVPGLSYYLEKLATVSEGVKVQEEYWHISFSCARLLKYA